MLITHSLLNSQTPRFWNNLCITLLISPYFGKLGWGFIRSFEDYKFFNQGELSPELVKYFKKNLLPNDSEEQICRKLIQTIFRLPFNYSRPDPVFEPNQEERYLHCTPNITSPRVEMIPLTDSDIHLADVQMFKNKLIILLSSWKEQILQSWKQRGEKLAQVKAKLTHWKQLIKSYKAPPLNF